MIKIMKTIMFLALILLIASPVMAANSSSITIQSGTVMAAYASANWTFTGNVTNGDLVNISNGDGSKIFRFEFNSTGRGDSPASCKTTGCIIVNISNGQTGAPAEFNYTQPWRAALNLTNAINANATLSPLFLATNTNRSLEGDNINKFNVTTITSLIIGSNPNNGTDGGNRYNSSANWNISSNAALTGGSKNISINRTMTGGRDASSYVISNSTNNTVFVNRWTNDDKTFLINFSNTTEDTAFTLWNFTAGDVVELLVNGSHIKSYLVSNNGGVNFSYNVSMAPGQSWRWDSFSVKTAKSKQAIEGFIVDMFDLDFGNRRSILNLPGIKWWDGTFQNTSFDPDNMPTTNYRNRNITNVEWLNGTNLNVSDIRQDLNFNNKNISQVELVNNVNFSDAIRQDADFIIYQEPGTVFDSCGVLVSICTKSIDRNGTVRWSNSNATSVINFSFNNASDGGLIKFRPGNYTIAPILISKRVSIEGSSRRNDVLLYLTNEGTAINYTQAVYGVHIKGFMINAAKVLNSVGLEFGTSSKYTLVENMYISGSDYSIKAVQTSADPGFEMVFTGNTLDGDISINNPEETYWIGNKIDNGLLTIQYSNFNTFIGNGFEDFGVEIQRGSNNRVIGNYWSQHTTTYTTDALKISGLSGSGYDNQSTIVQGNIFKLDSISGANAIKFNAFSHDVQGNIITDNIFIGGAANSKAITRAIQPDDGIHNNTISGNNFYGWDGSTLYDTDLIKNNTFLNNYGASPYDFGNSAITPEKNHGAGDSYYNTTSQLQYFRNNTMFIPVNVMPICSQTVPNITGSQCINMTSEPTPNFPQMNIWNGTRWTFTNGTGV